MLNDGAATPGPGQGWIMQLTMRVMQKFALCKNPHPPLSRTGAPAPGSPWPCPLLLLPVHNALGGLITRRVPLSSWPEVLTRRPGDVKVAVDLTK